MIFIFIQFLKNFFRLILKIKTIILLQKYNDFLKK